MEVRILIMNIEKNNISFQCVGYFHQCLKVVGCGAASEIWRALKVLFFREDKTSILQIRTKLQNFKKEGLSINDYMTSKKTSSIDALTFVGCN